MNWNDAGVERKWNCESAQVKVIQRMRMLKEVTGENCTLKRNMLNGKRIGNKRDVLNETYKSINNSFYAHARTHILLNWFPFMCWLTYVSSIVWDLSWAESNRIFGIFVFSFVSARYFIFHFVSLFVVREHNSLFFHLRYSFLFQCLRSRDAVVLGLFNTRGKRTAFGGGWPCNELESKKIKNKMQTNKKRREKWKEE